MNGRSGPEAASLHIGLVNNMPDAALEATERQFRTLLSEAAEGRLTVRLSLFALPEVPRAEAARLRISGLYGGLSELLGSSLDGLIVTGAEPLAASLADEPFWGSLTQVMDWARHHTHSSVWSCLAAQAFVLQADGIRRQPLRDKLCGVFEADKLADHVLTAGVPPRLSMPHSRWNDIPGEALAACGYRILTRLKNGMADAFLRQEKQHLAVFFQGHPEYEAASLLLEYRRDIRRFLNRERTTYPSMPQGYFDEREAAAWTVLKVRALSEAHEAQAFAAAFPAMAAPARGERNRWRAEALQLYRNWLHYVSEQKSKQLESRPQDADYPFEPALSVAAATERLLPEAEAG